MCSLQSKLIGKISWLLGLETQVYDSRSLNFNHCNRLFQRCRRPRHLQNTRASRPTTCQKRSGQNWPEDLDSWVPASISRCLLTSSSAIVAHRRLTTITTTTITTTNSNNSCNNEGDLWTETQTPAKGSIHLDTLWILNWLKICHHRISYAAWSTR